jgi:predicted metal-dependent RNase
VFVTHGESKSARAFADTVQEQTGLETYVPSYKERVELA